MIIEPIYEGVIIGSLGMLLFILVMYLINLVFFKRKKHDLKTIKDKLTEIKKASDIMIKNSDSLNQIMEALEYA